MFDTLCHKALLLLFSINILSYAGITTDSVITGRMNDEETLYQACSIHIVNDNYIATWLPGENGHYFGADDFITGSLLVNYYSNSWQYQLLFNAVTLRHFNLRYDLLSFIASRTYSTDPFYIKSSAGILLKGELGGDYFQNGYHKFRAIKRVDMPYSNDKGAGFIFLLTAGWKDKNSVIKNDMFKLMLESGIYSDYVASYISPGMSYQLNFWHNILQTELSIAYRKYINKVEEYSSLVRSGMKYGINLKINFYKEYYLDIGFITLPTKNIESDPKYPKYTHNYLPQAWIGFSWQSNGLGISDFLSY